jgi:hypothetical protein
MRLKLEIDCSNASFDENLNHEISHILHDLSICIERDEQKNNIDSSWSRMLTDSNGNRVGRAWMDR